MTIDLLRRSLPLVLLLVAAGVEALRLPVMLLLLGGFLLALLSTRGKSATSGGHAAQVYAACLLVAINMAWIGVSVPTPSAAAGCADPLAPFATYRTLGAVLVMSAVLLLARLLGTRPTALGLRGSSRGIALVALIALPVAGIAASLLGPFFAEPFFGPIPGVTAANIGGVLPALLFAVANASMEETVYRGALLRWLTPTLGAGAALGFQALVFGLAHGVGPDFTGPVLPVMAATAAAGLGLGLLAMRSGSLLLPIAVHAALDIPIYFAKACLGS